MNTKHQTIRFETRKENDIVRIDQKIHELLDELVPNGSGIVTVFCPGSTGSISTIEYEPGLIEDFPIILNKLIPKNNEYQHNSLNYDDNGHSHIRSTIIGPSLTIPFVQGRLTLGTWQQIIFLEFDTRGRSRRLEVMIIGD